MNESARYYFKTFVDKVRQYGKVTQLMKILPIVHELPVCPQRPNTDRYLPIRLEAQKLNPGEFLPVECASPKEANKLRSALKCGQLTFSAKARGNTVYVSKS